MRSIYLYVGGLFYLCAVVLFVFALIASLKTNGLFLYGDVPHVVGERSHRLGAGAGVPWRPVARRSDQDRPRPARSSTTRLSDCPRRGRTFTGSAELDVDA